MSRHTGPPSPPGGAGEPPPPEPTYAERARTLVHLGRVGTLATLSRRHPGHPFGSVMPYAPDDDGHPLLLISSLAMHTQNLGADSRASLLVTEPGWSGDPLAAGRVTLLGEARLLASAAATTARTAYLARHPAAAYWVDFEDFAFWRLEVGEIYFVGGFAAMDWIGPDAYRAARPDPLADARGGIVEHMNRDHPDALLTLARVVGRVPADEATMVTVDRLGFKLRVRAGEAVRSLRIPFPGEVRTPEETRRILIQLLRQARGSA